MAVTILEALQDIGVKECDKPCMFFLPATELEYNNYKTKQ